MNRPTIEMVDDFLNQHRLAFVGVSRDSKNFSRTLYDEFRKRGYDIVPVNPNMGDVDGQRCYSRVQDIQPPVDGALLLTTPQVTEQVVRDCAEAGVKRIWMQRGEGIGAVSPAAVAFCEQNGILVIAGQCPFMFLPEANFLHRLHGVIRKLTGSYPV